ncbi:hypothetical protein BDZ97DRAFT_1788497 [Flammula alnicola]|nr:hypothetical protein BDZ97DRAFT_1788497 [Flammula alnicola]
MSLNTNKRRLYLAYFTRTPSVGNPLIFHSAFLLCPKKIDVKSKDRTCKLMHVQDKLLPSGESFWDFVAEDVQGRPLKLRGLLLLAKIPRRIPYETIEDILKGIPRPSDASNPQWRCRHWVWAGVDALCEASIVPALPEGKTAKDLWASGYTFAEAKGKLLAGSLWLTEPVPTCDREGQEMHSEIGALSELG